VLVLTRKRNQSIIISKNIVLTILEIDGERVKLGISAPREVSILREELAEEIARENVEAAKGMEGARSALAAMKEVGAGRDGRRSP
jgi:carbon storage regulator